MHCDWKANQFIVRKKDYRLVLTDVDSVHFYDEARGRAFLDDVACSSAPESACTSTREECFQYLTAREDVCKKKKKKT